MPTPGRLLADARRHHGVDQRSLARRAGTSQAQISRIERGDISPSVDTLARLLAALGDRLDLGALPASPNESAARLRREYASSTPEERIAQAAELSLALTSIAAGDRDQ